ncbi:MAG TPA: hypothetical protein VMS64_31250 [Candidatus Methylomirabilis sp.]|nr:hypothetical protein [Candidatus Methylomirabilis sp.]
MVVLVDADGFIRATAPASIKLKGKGAPSGAMIVPGDGLTAHQVKMPDELEGLDASELHRRYRVELGDKPKLVKIDLRAPRRKS